MNPTKRKPKTDDSSARAYFFREGIEVCLVLLGLAIAAWFTHVSLWLWFVLPLGKILTSVLFYLFFVKRVFRQHPRHGLKPLIGRTARTLSPLTPDGQVKISGEIWVARSRKGDRVGSD